MCCEPSFFDCGESMLCRLAIFWHRSGLDIHCSALLFFSYDIILGMNAAILRFVLGWAERCRLGSVYSMERAEKADFHANVQEH
mmetsp:Transcript_4908/g.6849  ORF Transcript_4908/g.6849 Transcript_4908/m.6849 type:complete len:84 (+) Transcript_4908:69-320(+)